VENLPQTGKLARGIRKKFAAEKCGH